MNEIDVYQLDLTNSQPITAVVYKNYEAKYALDRNYTTRFVSRGSPNVYYRNPFYLLKLEKFFSIHQVILLHRPDHGLWYFFSLKIKQISIYYLIMNRYSL